MNKTDAPKKQAVPFGVNGQREDLLSTTPAGDNTASYDAGFPAVTMILKAAGGLPPKGQDMNQILYELASVARWDGAGAGYPFDSAFAASVGGYPAGAKIPSTDSAGYWLNITDANSTNPEATNGSLTGWVPVETYGVTSVSGLAAANVTLTSLQAAKERIKLAGALTASINIVVPAWTKRWTIVNGCTGSFTVTIKTPSGTGVAIPAGLTANVIGDGTNVIQDTSLLGPSGRLIGTPIVFTSSGTYTPSAGTKTIIVEGVGGGAGGGGSSTPPSGQYSAAGGGAGGTWARALFPVPTSTVNVTIGSGGSAGVASATSSGAGEGGQGGDSSFGTLLICPGGKTSKASNSFPSNSVTASEFTSHSSPPTVNGGTLLGSLNGAASTPGLVLGTYMISGRGGDSYYGRGAIGRYRAGSDLAAGAKADNYGGGGGGACSGSGQSGLVGGAGAPGVFYVWELS